MMTYLRNTPAPILTKNDNKKLVRGFTLVEAIMAMVIMAVVLTPFTILIATVMAKGNRFTQAQATAVALAESKMEEVTADRFSLAASAGPTAFAAPFANYQWQVVVEYVNAGALNTVIAGPTDYKRIQVRVIDPLVGTNTLVTILANDW
jgi:prepilin-type N-terminal cleavage/methylation domain-containing protein